MNIFFTGGGTLGPVTPLLAAIEALEGIAPDARPVWIGTRRGVEADFIRRKSIEYRSIPSGKLRRYFDLRNLLAPFLMFAGFVKSVVLIAMFRPKAVVGAGGYVEVPLMYAAKLCGVPVVVHQQDLEVGLANRLSAKAASAVTAAFPEAAKQFKGTVSVIGNPCRRLVSDLNDPPKRAEARKRGLARWKFDASRPTIVALGGGTGGSSLNGMMARNADKLSASANILLVTGRGKGVDVPPGKNFVAVEFLNDEIAEAYAVADLVVCRVGLGTLTEIGTLGLPAVLVPFAGHQENNAAYFSAKGAAVAVAPDVSDAVFCDTVLRLLADRNRRLLYGQKISDLFPPDAAARLARIIMENAK